MGVSMDVARAFKLFCASNAARACRDVKKSNEDVLRPQKATRKVRRKGKKRRAAGGWSAKRSRVANRTAERLLEDSLGRAHEKSSPGFAGRRGKRTKPGARNRNRKPKKGENDNRYTRAAKGILHY